MRAILSKTRVKINVMNLRHSAAPLMLNNGIDVIVASKLLGHAIPTFTHYDYGHLIPPIQNEQANEIA